jgi:hypothetical protein
MAKYCSKAFAFAAVVAAGMLIPAPAFAQNLNDVLNLLRGAVQQGMKQTAQAEWQKLPPAEISCLDQSLHQQGGSVDALVARGVLPSDPRLSALRSNCRSQTAQNPPAVTTQPSPYVVDGLALGGRVRFDSQAYQQYQCGPSDKFPGFTWCHAERTEKTNRGEVLLKRPRLRLGCVAANDPKRTFMFAKASGQERPPQASRRTAR